MPPGQSTVELNAALRRDAREGMSNRALEREYRVGWRTVQKALSSAWPQPREPYAARRSKLDPFKPVIDQMLLADLDAPRKQRHTVVRIYRRLINEHAMDDVSYQVVRAYVAKRKPEIRVEARPAVARPRCSSSSRTWPAPKPRSTSARSRSVCGASW